MTSSIVSGLPSWKVIPDRKRIVHSVPSSFGSIDSASNSSFLMSAVVRVSASNRFGRVDE